MVFYYFQVTKKLYKSLKTKTNMKKLMGYPVDILYKLEKELSGFDWEMTYKPKRRNNMGCSYSEELFFSKSFESLCFGVEIEEIFEYLNEEKISVKEIFIKDESSFFRPKVRVDISIKRKE